MSFSTQKTRALTHWVSTGYFGEVVTFYPSSPDIAERQIHVKVTENQRLDLLDESLTEDVVEELDVLCARDEAALDDTGNLLGGIASPCIGDAILRAESIDPEQRPYVWKGIRRGVSAFKHHLVFERKQRTAQGVHR